MRPRERRDSGQSDLFKARLDQIVDPSRPLAKLARTVDSKRYEKGTALVAAYSPRLKRIGIQNWRRASTVAGMSRQAFDAQRGVAKGIAGRPASSTQWNRIGRSR